MHIEFLVEDKSGAKLLEGLIPKILGSQYEPHTWNLHSYKGAGNLPKNLVPGTDPAKRILLDGLAPKLRGYSKTTGIDAVVVVVDSDRRDCKAFLQELQELRKGCAASPTVIMFRLAIEEVEAWYLGDRTALLTAYPKAKLEVLRRYRQDSVCGTWEVLADAIYPGGSKALKDEGWQRSGKAKFEWAEQIGPLLELDRNQSPSFKKLCDGLRRLIAAEV